MVSMRLKVALVTALSCLVLLLGLFGTAGVASAHSVQAAHTTTTASVSKDDRRCRFIVVRRIRFVFFFGRFIPVVHRRVILICHRSFDPFFNSGDPFNNGDSFGMDGGF